MNQKFIKKTERMRKVSFKEKNDFLFFAFFCFFFLKLVSNRRKDAIKTLEHQGFIVTLRVGVLRAKKMANSRINSKSRAYNFRFSQGDPDPEILFITSDPISPSHVYRVENHIIALRKLGIRCSWVVLDEIDLITSLIPRIRCAYFWRTGINTDEDWFQQLHHSAVKVIFDTDDLTFERESYTLKNVDGLNFVSSETKDHLMGKYIDQQLKLIEYSDICIGSTSRISEGYQELGKLSLVIPNLIPQYMQVNENFVSRKLQKSSNRVIGYASGSNTHRKDFEEVRSVLFEVLEKNNDWNFECLGFLPFDIKIAPKKIRKQIKVSPLVDQNNLLKSMQNWDIVLAPVEIGNPFTEAKSELKFVHASLVGAVTIASPTEPFRKAILDSVNGVLADTKAAWGEGLNRLVSSETLRKQIASRAFEKVSTDYQIESQLHIYRDLLKKIERTEVAAIKLPKNGRARILLLLNDPSLFSGGARMAINFATSLGEQAELKFSFMGEFSKKEIVDFSNHYDLPLSSFQSKINPWEQDLVIATFWKTAEFLQSFKLEPNQVIYFVQDFEPLFYPLNEDFMRAVATYRSFSDSIVTLGSWNTEILSRLLNIPAMFELDLPVDLSEYTPEEVQSEFDVLFFTRENSDRRLPELVKSVVSTLISMNSNLRIGVFGAKSSTFQNQKQVTFLGEISPSDLPALYRKSRLGVAFSPTNTSRIPLEMVATGLPVIDVHCFLEHARFKKDFPVIYSEPDRDSLTKVILQLLSDDNEVKILRNRAKIYASNLTSEIEFQQNAAKFLTSRLFWGNE
jgi:glycosyltransferase involved in cell wall biosynthesis